MGRELTEEIGQDRFDDFEDIFLLDETHLDVELIKLARRPVSPTVLVAKTGSDLEVAVKSCDHQELLELLRSLRQGVESAGVQTRRHQVVPRALGAGRRQDRRLELGEALRDHLLTQATDHCRAQHDVVMHIAPPQVEKAVGESLVL